MIFLYEAPTGFVLFKKLNKEDSQIQMADYKKFEDPLSAISTFEVLTAGKVPTILKDFLKSFFCDSKDTLIVSDKKIVQELSSILKIKVESDSPEVFREIRKNINSYLNINDDDFRSTASCIAHKLGHHSLKIDPSKIDSLVVQTINLLDDLDKDINTHCMRLREWYGFHFPELSTFLENNQEFLRSLLILKRKEFIKEIEKNKMLEFMDEERFSEIERLAEVSMGTEISENDCERICDDAKSVLKMFDYRNELNEYLVNRMQSVAPNLSALLGEMVGARILARAGSLANLIKYPASTLQILGAEKALFFALRNKSNTPKYGIIYHSSLVGHAPIPLKGKISRVLAAKASMAARIDAFSETKDNSFGVKARIYVEERMKQLEGKSKKKRIPQKTPKFKINPSESISKLKEYEENLAKKIKK
ncbi:fibrillarin-like nucleolar protein [Hamiltosporidium tvaerminnensis]|uniref:Nucleolar protein 58 n=1 Tax=Hamiltosporidium tvaerminnensis TaxID=1176355 RepID=A0A4Q9L249_9MICR|nr:Nucleolar protein 58 [Hamiltosporidium tvaerminnensis]TBU00921.1 fibrillarin-like nucleolar protein [Hamiltosporidium tvaerminnensis]